MSDTSIANTLNSDQFLKVPTLKINENNKFYNNKNSYSKSFTKERANFNDNYVRRFSQPQQDPSFLTSVSNSTHKNKISNLVHSTVKQKDTENKILLTNNSTNPRSYSNYKASSTRISQV